MAPGGGEGQVFRQLVAGKPGKGRCIRRGAGLAPEDPGGEDQIQHGESGQGVDVGLHQAQRPQLDAQLLAQLPAGGVLGGLAGRKEAAGDIPAAPPRLAAPPDQQDPVAVQDQDPGGRAEIRVQSGSAGGTGRLGGGTPASTG